MQLYRPFTAAEWRAWLEVNHAQLPRRLADLYEEGQRAGGIRYEEAVEEALCFGWIDSKAKSVDAERSLVTFTPRKAGGTWARSNKERMARLIEQGRMTPAGMAKIEQAQADGSWNRLEAIEDPAIPDDLAAALGGERGGGPQLRGLQSRRPTRVPSVDQDRQAARKRVPGG